MYARTIPTILIAGLLLTTTPAFADVGDAAVRSFFLREPGANMSEGAPTNGDPTGLATLEFEKEGATVYAARTDAFTEHVAIPREDAFHLRIYNREPTVPLAHDFTTWIRIMIYNPSLDVNVQNHSGDPYAFGKLTRTFSHPGGSAGDEVDGWTDFIFDSALDGPPPRASSCNAARDDCVFLQPDGVMHIPAGFSLSLEFGLVGSGSAASALGQAEANATSLAADAWVLAGDALAEHTPVDPDRPVAQFPQFNLTDAIERALRAHDGRNIESLFQGLAAPASTWRTSSTFSDSRLDVRVLE